MKLFGCDAWRQRCRKIVVADETAFVWGSHKFSVIFCCISCTFNGIFLVLLLENKYKWEAHLCWMALAPLIRFRRYCIWKLWLIIELSFRVFYSVHWILSFDVWPNFLSHNLYVPSPKLIQNVDHTCKYPSVKHNASRYALIKLTSYCVNAINNNNNNKTIIIYKFEPLHPMEELAIYLPTGLNR